MSESVTMLIAWGVGCLLILIGIDCWLMARRRHDDDVRHYDDNLTALIKATKED